MVRRPTNRGVTLIEMMVVVVIIAVLATMAYWGFSGVVPRYRLNVAARDVASLLVLTRAKAIAQNRSYIIEFQASSYRVVWDQDGSGTIDAGEPQTASGAYGRGVTYFRPTTDPLPAGDTVVFDPRGMAVNVTMNGQIIGLTNGPGQTREIQVRYSGLVKKL